MGCAQDAQEYLRRCKVGARKSEQDEESQIAAQVMESGTNVCIIEAELVGDPVSSCALCQLIRTMEEFADADTQLLQTSTTPTSTPEVGFFLTLAAKRYVMASLSRLAAVSHGGQPDIPQDLQHHGGRGRDYVEKPLRHFRDRDPLDLVNIPGEGVLQDAWCPRCVMQTNFVNSLNHELSALCREGKYRRPNTYAAVATNGRALEVDFTAYDETLGSGWRFSSISVAHGDGR
ncbi:hypothetical protein THAOC_21577 [Thalassiosira oceanica]|uniref:Uncharacterized protein n=1 Tax=Thalassiosira oceanica TaxID=159749 RepID=K0RX21_THAOC|nr:hypothetical protein THAOC_21577 [Thalassiosira oceanica]|eukprot:EJK58313.1 hypothetical protein THAOC_21577 [Thalassiosira oceanica]